MDDNNEDKNVLIHAVRTLLTVVKEKLPENTEKNKGKAEESEQLKITLESILEEALPTIFIDEREDTKYIVDIICCLSNWQTSATSIMK